MAKKKTMKAEVYKIIPQENDFVLEYPVGEGEKVVVHGKKFIPFNDAADIIEIVSAAVSENDGYNAAIESVLFRRLIVEKYTDVECNGESEETFALLFNTSLFDDVVDQISIDQFQWILTSIDKMSDYTKSASAAKMSVKVAQLMGEFADLSEKLQAMTSNLDGVDLASVFSKIGQLDDKAIVEAMKE